MNFGGLALRMMISQSDADLLSGKRSLFIKHFFHIFLMNQLYHLHHRVLSIVLRSLLCHFIEHFSVGFVIFQLNEYLRE
jgi:hypothetical protein